MVTSTERIAMEVLAARHRMDGGFRSPQLRSSAMDNGAFSITTLTGPVDTFGNPTPSQQGIFGVQFDGTTTAATVNGPAPPQPVVPTVTPTPNGLEIYYSGAFVGGVTAPMDWARAEIHVSQTNDITGLMASTRKALLPNANGATVNVSGLSPAIGYYVAVIAWSQAGKPSLVSATVGPVQPALLPPELVDIDFNTLGTHLYYTTDGNPPAVTEQVGDLWLEQIDPGPPPRYTTSRWNGTTWVLLADQTATLAALAAEAAATAAAQRAKLYTQDAAPTGLGGADTAIWVDTNDGNRSYSWGGSSWVSRRLGNGAIEPASLVASTVLVTGSVSAALLEAILVLATTIIAGDPTGSHARMEPTGFRVFRPDPDVVGGVEEVLRLGTITNDYFGVVNSAGNLVASVDDTGSAAFANLNVAGNFIVQGKLFDEYIAEANQPAGSFRGMPTALYATSYWGPIQNRVGIAEVNGWLTIGRRYSISWQCHFTSDGTGHDESDFTLHARSSSTDTATAPVVTDAALEHWAYTTTTLANARWLCATGTHMYTATVTGRHRFLLATARGQGVNNILIVGGDSRFPVTMDISDLGPAKPFTGQLSQGSGTFFTGSPPAAPPQPVQQFNTGWMPPVSWLSFNGAGTQRNDVAGPVQGWDPSGFNGDGYGYWWWTLPSISGTVDEVWVWLYSSHWYYNSGGTAILYPIAAGPVGLAGSYLVGGFPKPGSVQVNITGWKNLFHNNQSPRGNGIQVGRAGTTDLTYYGRFDGPSARLLIKYTQ